MIVAPFILPLATCFQAPATLFAFDAPAPESTYARAIATIGDLDGDGRPEFAVSAHNDSTNGTFAGKVYVHRGGSGAVLCELLGEAPDDRFGFALAAAGDMNLDGSPDLLVGSLQSDVNGIDSGACYVISGAYLSGFPGSTFVANPANPALVIRRIDGQSAGDKFGTSVGAVGDLNADGVADFAVGAVFDELISADSGSVRVVAGSNGASLYSSYGLAASDAFGRAISGCDDVNGDSIPDFSVGATGSDSGGLGAGSIYVLSGANGSILTSSHGSVAGLGFGLSIDTLGDLNGDGRRDLIVGVGASSTGHPGYCTFVSSSTGQALFTALGSNNGDGFGLAVANAGDVNRDGYLDAIVGAYTSLNNMNPTGYVRILSGASLAQSWTVAGQPGERIGVEVSGLDDLNGDFYAEVAVTSLTGGVNGTGTLRVFTYGPARYPGTGEDFVLLTGLNGAPPTTGIAYDQKTAHASDILSIRFESPGLTFVNTATLLLGQLLATGGPTPVLPGYPSLHVNPFAGGFIVFNALTAPFGPLLLPPGGLTFNVAIPAGLFGNSLMLQALSLSSTAINGVFAATDGHEIAFQ